MSTSDTCHPFRRFAATLALSVSALLFAPGDASAAARDVELTGTLNLNTATETELRQLPGIGPAKAQRILEQRAKKKFTSTEQLMKVKGIGKKTYRKLKPHLALAGPTNLQKKPKSAKSPATAASRARPPAEAAPAPEPEPSEEVEVIRAMPSASLDAARARALRRLTVIGRGG